MCLGHRLHNHISADHRLLSHLCSASVHRWHAHQEYIELEKSVQWRFESAVDGTNLVLVHHQSAVKQSTTSVWPLRRDSCQRSSHVLHTSIESNQPESHRYRTDARQCHLAATSMSSSQRTIGSHTQSLPGKDVAFPRDVMVLSNKRLPRIKVRKNCCSSSLITSLTSWGSFRSSVKNEPRLSITTSTNEARKPGLAWSFSDEYRIARRRIRRRT